MIFIWIAVAAVLVILAVDAWLEFRDRQAEARECSPPLHPCPECQREPPSQLDRWDGVR